VPQQKAGVIGDLLIYFPAHADTRVSLSLRLRDVNAKTSRRTSLSQVTFRESEYLDNAANYHGDMVRIFIHWPPAPPLVCPLSPSRHHANTRVYACNCECNDDPRGSEKKVITDCSRASPFYSPARFSLFPPPVTWSSAPDTRIISFSEFHRRLAPPPA